MNEISFVWKGNTCNICPLISGDRTKGQCFAKSCLDTCFSLCPLVSFGFLSVPKRVFAHYRTVNTQPTDQIVHTKSCVRALCGIRTNNKPIIEQKKKLVVNKFSQFSQSCKKVGGLMSINTIA